MYSCVTLFDHSNKAVAALSVSGPEEWLSRQKMHEYIMKALEAGRNISRALGYKGSIPE
jgi:DNA-binding IclR family transcriptional regulator